MSSPPPNASAVSANTLSRSSSERTSHSVTSFVSTVAARSRTDFSIRSPWYVNASSAPRRPGARRSPTRSSACSRPRARAPVFPRACLASDDPNARDCPLVVALATVASCARSLTTCSRIPSRPATVSRSASTGWCARRWNSSRRRRPRRGGSGLGRARPDALGRLARPDPGRPSRATRGARARAAVVARARRAGAACNGGDDPGRPSIARGRHRDEPRRGDASAFADVGRGFCVFNDVVTAFRVLRSEGSIVRALVVDVDVHQGDGTHALLAADAVRSRCRSTAFATTRSDVSPATSRSSSPTARRTSATSPSWSACFPRRFDELARSSASCLPRGPVRGRSPGAPCAHEGGPAARDRLIRDTLLASGVPVCVTLAGGYAADIRDTVAINVNTVRAFTSLDAR